MSTRLLLLLTAFLLCAPRAFGQPPAATTDEARREIAQAVLGARPNIFDGLRDAAAVEVVAIKLSGWKKEDLPGVRGGAPGYASNWTAKLRFKEPLGFILYQLDGVKVVRIIAQPGDELEFAGLTTAAKLEGQWGAGAIEQSPSDGGPWQPLWDKAGDVTMAYKVFGDENRTAIFRGATFEPVSRLAPYAVEGSAEEKALVAAAQERQTRAREAALAQQERRQREAEEKQKAYEAEQQRIRDESAEKQRLAREEAKRKADEARHVQLAPLLQPFQSPTGAVIATEAGPAMGVVILKAEVDEPNLTAQGTGVDLREMPFREFTFDASVDTRTGALNMKSSIADDPMTFGLFRGAVVTRSRLTLAPLDETGRGEIDRVVALGQRLQSAAPPDIKVEVIDAAAAKAREPQFQTGALTGTVFYKGRVAPQVAPLFAGNIANKRPYMWRNNEIVAIRLNDAAKGSGLYIRGGTSADTENLVVTINGVHPLTIPSIPKLGGVLLALPSDFELLDLRFEAQGIAQSRAIALVK